MGKWEKFEQGDRVKGLVYGNDDIQEMEFRAGTIIYPLNFIPDDGTQILEIELDKPDFKGNKRITRCNMSFVYHLKEDEKLE